MELTTQGFYRVSIYTKDNNKEFKQYYVAADSIQEATVIVEDKLKKGNISDSVYINSVLNMGQCLIRETEKKAELPLKNKDVTERIKTFEDAYHELGCEHPFCKAWDSIYQGDNEFDKCDDIKDIIAYHKLLCKAWDSIYQGDNEFDKCDDIKDIIAYHKLRIIVAALNEGWKPEFTEDEYRYYPFYCFYTKQEYDNLSDEEKEKCCAVGRANNYAFAYGGIVYAYANNALSDSGTNFGSRLAFENRKLAEYAGKQFIDIYKDFIA